MLCDICKKNKATLHIKNNINGIIIERDICNDCYSKSTGGEYTSTLARIYQSLSSGRGFNSVPSKKCSKCGTKLSSILDSLYVGCANCYSELGDFIMPSIRNVQGAAVHKGKRPLIADENANVEFDRLKRELAKAIDNECFEEAAIISARLKQLRGEG